MQRGQAVMKAYGLTSGFQCRRICHLCTSSELWTNSLMQPFELSCVYPWPPSPLLLRSGGMLENNAEMRAWCQVVGDVPFKANEGLPMREAPGLEALGCAPTKCIFTRTGAERILQRLLLSFVASCAVGRGEACNQNLTTPLNASSCGAPTIGCQHLSRRSTKRSSKCRERTVACLVLLKVGKGWGDLVPVCHLRKARNWSLDCALLDPEAHEHLLCLVLLGRFDDTRPCPG